MLSDLRIRLRSLFRREAVEAELDEELRFHQQQQLEKYMKSGLTEAESVRRVREHFGGADQIKEECRDARGVRIMDSLIQDLRYGFRMLRKSPGFTATVVLTLGLGIGANSAIFSILYSILLRPLPYANPSELIILNETTPRVGMVAVSIPNFQDWRAQSRAFSEMAVVNSVGFNLSGVDQPETITGEAVSPNFLRMLGTRPFAGRDFEAQEEKPGAAPVALVSFALWQSRFGGEAGAIGRSMDLDGRAYTIVGILPADFRWFEKTDLLIPIGNWAANNSAYTDRGDRGDTVVAARLAAGVSLTQARAEMEGIAARLENAYPASNDQFGVALRPIRDVFVSGIRPALLVLFAAVTFVLLIACANVSNLVLIRGASRIREVALRMAIGATRGRVIAQMLVESFILTSIGGLTGLLFALTAIRGVSGLIPAPILAGATLDLNGAALLFATIVVTLAAFVFGLAPALHLTSTELQSQLKETGRTASLGMQPSRWRSALVVAEVSLALVLLVGAGLMMKSVYRLLAVDAGIRSEHVLTVGLNLRAEQYKTASAVLNFWDQTLARVRALPGIQSAALGSGIPLSDNHWRTDITIEGMALPTPGNFPHPDIHVISPDYIRALGVKLQRGRTFTDSDNEKAPRTAIVNARVAQQFFANTDPVGKRFQFGHPRADPAEWLTIVGVVGDTKLYGLENPSRLEIYIPLRQKPRSSMTLVVKSAVDPAALTAEVRGVIASINKDQPLSEIATMNQLVEGSVSTRRITFVALGTFSGLALALAAIGIYGVISYSVAQRRQEMGIRIALGARPADVLGLVIAQGARLVGAGVLIGILASLALTRSLANLLFSVSSTDPATFAAVTLTLGAIAMLASYIPARRILRLDPIRTLRCE